MTDQLAADGLDDEPQDVVDDAAPPDTSQPVDSADHADDHDADLADDTDGDLDGSESELTDPESVEPAARRKRQRLSRWDRPPEPRDWRFYVGGVGKTLIATGLLVFGFVAYQLWGTGIETARAQNQLENEFETLLAEFGGAETTAGSAADTNAGDSNAGDTNAGETSRVVDAAPVNDPVVRPEVDDTVATGAEESSEGAGGDEAGAAEVIPVALDLADQAVVQDPIPQPFRGDPLLRLEIPKIGRDDIVVPGVALNDLKDGPGHYPDTPLPGQLGNASIAGHRTTYGAPFYDVDQLSAGDEIVTTLLNGDRFVYEVTFVEVVAATDYWVVATTDPNIAELTLTSCHPKYTARDRIVVHSVLNAAKSSNVGVPTFYTLDADPVDAPIPGDDPVLSASADDQDPSLSAAAEEIEITEPADADGTSDPVTDADPTDGSSAAQQATADSAIETGDPAAPVAAGTTATAATADTPTPIDAFDQGWFHDAGAFPQLALWGLVLALISVVAYQVAKRFRRVWVGVMLGTVPFLVALYFFYQNVNRLLPAGI